MNQNIFLCLVLDNPNTIVEHWGMNKIIKFTCLFEWKTFLDWATFIQLVNISQYSETGSKKSKKSEKWPFKKFRQYYLPSQSVPIILGRPDIF